MISGTKLRAAILRGKPNKYRNKYFR
jgi:hypothetical protein